MNNEWIHQLGLVLGTALFTFFGHVFRDMRKRALPAGTETRTEIASIKQRLRVLENCLGIEAS